MRALTVKQPWAQWIVRGRKTEEFRNWTPGKQLQVGERFAIHSSLGPHPIYTAAPFYGVGPGAQMGSLLGTVVYLGVREESTPWGKWAWLLGDAMFLLQPIPARGRLGLWKLTKAQEESLQCS